MKNPLSNARPAAMNSTGKPVLRIDWATHEAAKFACLNWHYSKAVPKAKLVKVGAWENGKFIGVVIFSYGANQNLGNPYGCSMQECVELTRIALTKHETPVSKIMALAFMFLKKQSPGIRLLVSYADLDQGHHGGIYQATNWVYEGLCGVGSQAAYIINGEKLHNKTVYDRYGTRAYDQIKKIHPTMELFYTKGKHKYLLPLDAAMREQIAPLAKPYPKSTRVKKQDSGHPSELGGAVPTDTLHSSTG